MASHYGRRENTRWGLLGLADGVRYKVNASDGRSKTKTPQLRQVTSGKGAQRVLRRLCGDLVGGFAGPSPLHTPVHAVDGAKSTRHPGAASWVTYCIRGTDNEPIDVTGSIEPWELNMMNCPWRPRDDELLAAQRTWFGCGRVGDDSERCEEIKCPHCWSVPSGGVVQLTHTTLECSRYGHGASRMASSGSGRWKSGDVRSAEETVPADKEWALGNASGESVEVYATPKTRSHGLTGVGHLTLCKILYFFDHLGNGRDGQSLSDRARTKWVMVFSYATQGPSGGALVRDDFTKHPVYVLRSGRAELYPAAAIRGHVHVVHQCPFNGPCACGCEENEDGSHTFVHKSKTANTALEGTDIY